MTLAEKLKQLRACKHLTQQQLIELSGVKSLKNIEAGKVKRPRWQTLMALAESLNVSYNILKRYSNE